MSTRTPNSVARLASVEVIDAAFKTLAKLHHPDVSATGGDERIKRLNLAHDWLTDPLRRRRYDNSTRAEAAPAGARGATTGVLEPTDRSGRTSSATRAETGANAKAFGPPPRLADAEETT